MKALDEWQELISNKDRIFIYGAGQVAIKLKMLLEYSGKKNALLGYVVSQKSGNPNEIDGVPVVSLDDIIDKKSTILMSLSHAYHPEVFERLHQEGYTAVIHAHKFYNIDLKNEDIKFDKEAWIDETSTISREKMEYRDSMMDKFFEYNHAFGNDGFYQSCPMLGVKGLRDTKIRLKTYNLEEFIFRETSILDIGANIGFLDIELAQKSGEIIGLEYSDILVEIANDTANFLGLNNINFINADYNEWQRDNNKRFDMIFSFAVHAWLNIKPKEYAVQISDMLKKKGVIVFESQQLSTDTLFEKFVSVLKEENFRVLREGMIKDDGETDRKFYILEKQ